MAHYSDWSDLGLGSDEIEPDARLADLEVDLLGAISASYGLEAALGFQYSNGGAQNLASINVLDVAVDAYKRAEATIKQTRTRWRAKKI